MQYGHAEGAARHRRQRRLSVLAEPPPRGRELLHALGPRRRPLLRGAEHREQLRLPQLPRSSTSKKACISNGVARRALLPGSGEQPRRLARQLRAANRDEPDLREVLYQRPRLDGVGRRRSCSPTSRRAVSGCSTARRRYARRRGQLERVQHRRRPADADQVRRELRRSQARFPVAPLPLHPDRRQQGRRRSPINLPLTPEELYTSQQHRHALPLQRGDAARSTPTTASRRRPPATAWSTSRSRRASRLIAGARVERFDQDGEHVRSVRPLRAHAHRGRTRTPTSSPASTSSIRCGRTEPSRSATARRSIGRSSASWRSSSSPTSSAAAPSAAIPIWSAP